MSTTAASHLSPAFPERAAWGTASKLRAWQAAALEQYLESTPRDFLAVATPGAGKTTYALRARHRAAATGASSSGSPWSPPPSTSRPSGPTPPARVGIHIDPQLHQRPGAARRTSSTASPLTYAQVASKPLLHRARTEAAPTLVILDEVHHGGDTLSLGRRHPRGVRARHPAAVR